MRISKERKGTLKDKPVMPHSAHPPSATYVAGVMSLSTHLLLSCARLFMVAPTYQKPSVPVTTQDLRTGGFPSSPEIRSVGETVYDEAVRLAVTVVLRCVRSRKFSA